MIRIEITAYNARKMIVDKQIKDKQHQNSENEINNKPVIGRITS